MGNKSYTVVGYCEIPHQRRGTRIEEYIAHKTASSGIEARHLAQAEADERGHGLHVCAVYEGKPMNMRDSE